MLSEQKVDARAAEAFLLIQLRVFWQSNVFALLKVKTNFIREQPVFFTCHELAALVGDWWLRILQVSVKLFTGCLLEQ